MKRSIDLLTYTEVASIPDDQPPDVQTHVQCVQDEHAEVQRIWFNVEIAEIGFSRDARDGIDEPCGLPEVDQTPDRECPTCMTIIDIVRDVRERKLPAGVNSVRF